MLSVVITGRDKVFATFAGGDRLVGDRALALDLQLHSIGRFVIRPTPPHALAEEVGKDLRFVDDRQDDHCRDGQHYELDKRQHDAIATGEGLRLAFHRWVVPGLALVLAVRRKAIQVMMPRFGPVSTGASGGIIGGEGRASAVPTNPFAPSCLRVESLLLRLTVH